MKTAEFLDSHPLNMLDRRLDDVMAVFDALTWADDVSSLPDEALS